MDFEKDTQQIIAVVDGNKLYYQTTPYIDPITGKLTIKRLSTIDIEIIDIQMQTSMRQQVKDWSGGSDV